MSVFYDRKIKYCVILHGRISSEVVKKYKLIDIHGQPAIELVSLGDKNPRVFASQYFKERQKRWYNPIVHIKHVESEEFVLNMNEHTRLTQVLGDPLIKELLLYHGWYDVVSLSPRG